MKASIDSIETFGLVDGPGIRTVIFFNKCLLRCKYCHNPEMWTKKENNYTAEEIAQKIIRCKPYFRNKGGVTFSGGEPLLNSSFIIEVAKILKPENIHIAIDTAGYGNDDYDELLDYIDLVILDIKHTTKEGLKSLTGGDIEKVERFIDALNKKQKKVWIRQVIIPGVTDNTEYITSLAGYLQKINNIEKIEFLPYHHLGKEKYETLKIPYPYKDKPEMDKEKCQKLYEEFKNIYKKISK